MRRVVHFFGLILFVISFNAQAFAQPVVGIQEKVDGPILSVENDTYDYGTIEYGSDGTREFTITNTGNQPLIISLCKGSCGCTVPLCPKKPILPGESAIIKVTYKTSKVGPINRTVYITSNAVNSNAKPSIFELYIKGNVKPEPVGGPPVDKSDVPSN